MENAEAITGKAGVVLLPADTCSFEHELKVHEILGASIARMLGCRFLGTHDGTQHPEGKRYFIPAETLIGSQGVAVGIQTEDDLFGGIVPFPFLATKAISHELNGLDADAPPGWSNSFQELAGKIVLPGCTAFSLDDALKGGIRLLLGGPVRIKPVRAKAGKGQIMVASPAELNAALSALDTDEIATWGLVLEEHLNDVVTYSVGQVRVAGEIASYYGTQTLTADNTGELVYGGSDLTVVRGDYGALLKLELSQQVLLAITQAQLFEHAALVTFPGLIASRRNYDVAQGVNSRGHRLSGVLEQSWRIGGASSAEIHALEAFRQDGSLQCIRASTREVYGENASQPMPGEIITYQGEDPSIGYITKSVRTSPYGNRD